MGEVRSTSGPIPELVIAGVDVEIHVESNPINSGPAHLVNQVSFCPKMFGGCEVEGSLVGGVKRGSGPKILKTKKGDLSLVGPSLGLSVDFVESFGDHQLVKGGMACHSFSKTDLFAPSSSTGVKKKQLDKRRNLPNLPFNMLRKLPGPIHGTRKGKNKKDNNKAGGHCRPDEGGSDSDPIRTSSLVVHLSNPIGVDVEGINLEVVLPLICGENMSSQLVAEGCSSGLKQLVEGGGFIVEEDSGDEGMGSQNNEGVSPSRELVEVKKLIEISEDLGLNFHNRDGVETDRMLPME
jgi:hypothetical protein